MWRSIFLHEFLDTNIRNFQALPGTPTPDSLTLTPSPSPPLRTNHLRINPGRGFTYSLAQFLDQVIGISGRVRLTLPGHTNTHVPVMRVGDMAEFRILPDPTTGNPHTGVPVKGLLRIDQTEIELGTIILSMDTFSDIKFVWHTSGQARLIQDGQVVAYQNAVAPGAQLGIAYIAFGIPGVPPAENIIYQIGRVFVRALRRPDSLSDFSKLYPKISFPDPRPIEECQLSTINNLLAMGDQLRQFMSLFHQNFSQPWTTASGPAEGPFKPEAVAAHELATHAALEFARMVRSGDFSTAHTFLEPFENFLRILHDAQPAEFTAFADQLISTLAIPEDCTALVQSILDKNKEMLEPLIDLLSKANDRARDIAGGF
jgi:hypothetical protein